MNGNRNRRRPGLASWLAIALAIVLADQLTKQSVLLTMAPGERIGVIAGLFDLTLLFNRGAAFSLLASASGWQRWFFIGVGIAAAVFITWLLLRHAGQKLFATALTLILGGAVGNVIDRALRGEVVDFLLFYQGAWYFPAFNLADSAITCGAVLLIVDEILRVRRAR
jgi:signal peptidase II